MSASIPEWAEIPVGSLIPPSVLSATFSLRCATGFPPELVADWSTVPGVRAGPALVSMPWSARPVVWASAQAAGLQVTESMPYGVVAPRPWGPDSPDEIRARLLESPVRPWLLTGKMDAWERLERPRERPFGLLAYQVGALWHALELGGGLWDEAAGAGKTVQALLWLALQPLGPVLLVTKRGPALQVAREVGRFLYTEAYRLPPPSSMKIRKGEREQLTDALSRYILTRQALGERPVLVTTWDSLRAHGESLLSAARTFGFVAVVFDECHMAKSKDRTSWVSTLRGPEMAGFKGSRSAYAWRLAQVIPRRLGMSATLVFDRRADLYGQFTLVEPAGWGKTGTAYGLRYCNGVPGRGGSLDTSGVSNTDELRARMATLVYHVPKAVSHAGLPPVHLITRHIPPEDQAKTSGFRSTMRYWARIAGRGDPAGSARLRELEIQEAAARKRPATLEVIGEELGRAGGGDALGKVIVFTGRHRDCWDLYEQVQAKWPGVQTWCGLRKREEGAESSAASMTVLEDDDHERDDDPAFPFVLLTDDERQAVQDAYMAHPGPCVLVATGYSWGTGLDLQDTDALILNMLPYSPGDFDQWYGRIERHGMTRACNVYLLVAEGTADVRISEVLAEKAPDVERLTGQQSMKGLVASLRGLDRADEILDRLLARLNAAGQDWEDEEDGGS